MIPPAFVHDLLARTDIAELIGRTVELKRAGPTWKGLCPFHGEKTPSFTVSPQRQTYHCFGCGVHGNAIGFLMEQQGLGFLDAVHELAQKAGLAVPEDTRSAAERDAAAVQKQKGQSLSEVLGRAAEHYRKQLKASPRAIDYLKGRGLSGAVAARFGLGYAPDGWRSLASAFPDYDDPQLAESGLVVVREAERGTDDDGGRGEPTQTAEAPSTGKRYDRFRDRIMFPIRSVQGDVIGFGGRILDRGEPGERRAAPSKPAPPRGAASAASVGGPKYLNSPETPVFSKGRELYGLFEARTAIRQRGYVLVVEGYMDVVALDQSGFGNAVATLGTACTAEHVLKLVRFSESVVFSFDGDAAGRRAATRALEASLPHATDTRSFSFLFLPAEHDPDSFVRANGAEAFEAAVAGAVPLSKQLVAQAGDDADFQTAEGRARFLAAARPLWATLSDGMLKRQLLGEIAGRGGLPVDELASAWRTARGLGGGPAATRGASGDAGAGSAAPPPFGSRAGAASRRARPGRTVIRQPVDRIAWMLLLHGDWWETLAAADHAALCGLDTWHGAWFRYLDRLLAEHGAEPWALLRERIAGEPWAEAALALVDQEDPAIEPVQEDLQRGAAQLREAPARREADRMLGRL